MAETMSGRGPTLAQPVASPPREASVSGLIRSLADDVTRLFQQEVALAKSEVSTAVSDIKAGLVSLAIGFGILFAGVFVLLFAAVDALALVVEPWLAGLIVGGLVALIGLMLLMKAKKALNPEQLVPTRTIDSLKKDEQMVRRTVA